MSKKCGKFTPILPRILTYCFAYILRQSHRLEKTGFFLETQSVLFSCESLYFSVVQKNTANITLNPSTTGFSELLSYHLLVLLELYKAHELHILRII